MNDNLKDVNASNAVRLLLYNWILVAPHNEEENDNEKEKKFEEKTNKTNGKKEEKLFYLI